MSEEDPKPQQPSIGTSCSSMPFFGGPASASDLYRPGQELLPTVDASPTQPTSSRLGSAGRAKEGSRLAARLGNGASSPDKASGTNGVTRLGRGSEFLSSSSDTSPRSSSSSDDGQVPSAIAAALSVIQDDDDEVVGDNARSGDVSASDKPVMASLVSQDLDQQQTSIEESAEHDSIKATQPEASGSGPGSENADTQFPSGREQDAPSSAEPTKPLDRDLLLSFGFDVDSMTALEQAVAVQLLSSKDSLLLSHLAALPDLRELASNEGRELRKPFFLDRPHLFQCVQEDRYTTRYTTRISVAPVSMRQESDRAGTQPASPTVLPKDKSDEEKDLSPVGGKNENSKPSSSPQAKSSRQLALQQLEEDVLSYIRSSEQRSVFLGRFGGLAALRRLAQKAGVELKKPFFAERPHLFRCIQDSFGTIRVVAVDGEHDHRGANASPHDELISDGDEKEEEEEEENSEEESDESDSNDASTSEEEELKDGASENFSSGKEGTRKTSWDSALEEMEKAALVFAYQSAGHGTVLLALFGQNKHLKRVAARAHTQWRKPFFTERGHLFSCFTRGVTAMSVELTELGFDRAMKLYKAGLTVPANNPPEGITYEDSSLTPSQQLERGVVAFLQTQPDQTAFLHIIAVEPSLQRLAKASGEILRKPYYEGRPHLFRVQYIQSTTVIVSLVTKVPANARPANHQPNGKKPGSGKSPTLNPVQLLENALADFILASTEDPLYLSRIAQDLRLQEMAQAAGVRLGKAFFMERSNLFTITQIGLQSAKLTVRLNLSKLSSGRLPATVSSPLASGPGVRRLENAAVSQVVQAGAPVPLQRMCSNPMLVALAKQYADLNAAFFEQRPHLFHCTTTGDMTTVGPPISTGHLYSLEQAVETFLLSYNGQVELGILGNDKHLSAVAGKVRPGTQITKAFFLARPHLFHLIQRGSRAEVALVKRDRRTSQKAAQSSMTSSPYSFPEERPASLLGSTSVGKIPSDLPTRMAAPEESSSSDVVRWEDLYKLTLQTTESDDDETTTAAASASSDWLAQTSPSVPVTVRSPAHVTPPGPSIVMPSMPASVTAWPDVVTAYLQPESLSSASTSLWQPPNTSHSASLGHVNATPSYFGTSPYQPLTSNVVGSRTAQSKGSSLSALLSSSHPPVTSSNGWPDYIWDNSSHGIQSGYTSRPRAHKSALPAVDFHALPQLSEEQLDVAERKLLTTVPSLAYSLRLHRLNQLDTMLESLQLDRLRAELLQLQLSRGQPVLTLQETYLTTQSTSTEECYEIAVILNNECIGKGQGTWKAAKVKAMVEAAARLSLP